MSGATCHKAILPELDPEELIYLHMCTHAHTRTHACTHIRMQLRFLKLLFEKISTVSRLYRMGEIENSAFSYWKRRRHE